MLFSIISWRVGTLCLTVPGAYIRQMSLGCTNSAGETKIRKDVAVGQVEGFYANVSVKT